MKILLINISLRPSLPKKVFPTGLCYVASAMERAGYKFDVIDIDAHRYSNEELENMLRKTDFDVVALGSLVTGYKTVKWISSLIKKTNKKAVIAAGNSVASSIPHILLSKTDVDIAVFGEGDTTIVELLKCLEKKHPKLEDVKGIAFKIGEEVRYAPQREVIKDIDSIPFPNRDLFPVNIYIASSKDTINKPYPIEKEKIRALPVNTARGCVYKCTFCYHVFINTPYRYRSPQSIVSEIKELKKKYALNYISMWDDLTFFSKKQFAEFADLMLKDRVEVFWAGSCRGNLFDESDLALLRNARKAGCVALGYSIESANKEILAMMKKGHDPHAFAEQKRALVKAGICTLTSVVLGYPIETEETLKETFDFCYDNDIYPSTGFLLPQPGTPIYEYALKNKLIADEEEYIMRMGDRQDFTINLTKIPDVRFQELVYGHLDRINKKMGLGLSKDHLVKTTVHQPKL